MENDYWCRECGRYHRSKSRLGYAHRKHSSGIRRSRRFRF